MAKDEKIALAVEALSAMINAYWRGSEDSSDRNAPKAVKLALKALTRLQEPDTKSGNDADHLRDLLHDLVMLKDEEWALSGGGPGIAERWKKAWAAAAEVFEP